MGTPNRSKWGSKIDQNGDPKSTQNGDPKSIKMGTQKSIKMETQNRSKIDQNCWIQRCPTLDILSQSRKYQIDQKIDH